MGKSASELVLIIVKNRRYLEVAVRCLDNYGISRISTEAMKLKGMIIFEIKNLVIYQYPPIEFDKSRDHLATGDRGGNVVLFERTDVRDHGSRMELERPDYPVTRHPKFRYKTEFQSHEPELDVERAIRLP
ncbi:uncharacterized protein A4U43_UnF11230 [Asparagus officinalis]|uniref:Uncharacterized protein n=1 Tax=Asparagus officinalis TaxID=4686 RepID=A0A1R3L5A8_ASPOF|nr:uncharacterized protein A4U43_UnF11230 [Asparagus officinalis]